MYERGPYAKGRERREAILRTTLDVFSQNGYRGASLRAIARELDVSPALLQHYLKSHEDLLTEVVTEWDAENRRRSDGMTHLGHWLTAIRHNTEIPGLIRLYTALAVEATDPEHTARPYFQRRYDNLTQEIVDDVEAQKRAGTAPADIDTERIARLLIAACEGLQIRWLHSPDFDMYDEFVFLLREFRVFPPEEEVALRAAQLELEAAQSA
ncbi:TetR/AcrR family transcriptional regulator [Streptomyces bacillaris]|uniref:TetR/AcrR family transcriptional regulator n=1 Tax=Streptomyces bacillaris TaxID=68179 RepID=UPI0036DD3D46